MPPKQARGEYIETETGNKVSRRAYILGTQNIILGGKTVIQAECTIRGDLYRTMPSTSASSTATNTTTTSSGGSASNPASQPQQPQQQQTSPSNVAVSIGRYCILCPGCVLRPPSKMHRGHYSHWPLKMGDHVFVGDGAVVEAASVGSHVHIGKGAVLGRFAIVKDAVWIVDGAVLPPNMVVPPFSVVAGCPASVVAELPEGEYDGLDLREAYRRMK